MEFILELLKSAFGAALLAGFFGIWQWRLNRKAHKEDKAADAKLVNCAARGAEIKQLQETVNALVVANRTILYDRIKHSAFFMVQLSHLYMTTGKAIALTIWTSCQQSAVSAI